MEIRQDDVILIALACDEAGWDARKRQAYLSAAAYFELAHRAWFNLGMVRNASESAAWQGECENLAYPATRD